MTFTDVMDANECRLRMLNLPSAILHVAGEESVSGDFSCWKCGRRVGDLTRPGIERTLVYGCECGAVTDFDWGE